MTRRYLYPSARRAEVTMALFAGGFGFHAWYLNWVEGLQVLAWAGPMAAAWGGYALVAASLIHGAGIRANGRLGLLSPLLRLLAMAFFALFFAGLAWAGTGTTAAYTYGTIAVGIAIGAGNAAADTKDALTGMPAKWNL